MDLFDFVSSQPDLLQILAFLQQTLGDFTDVVVAQKSGKKHVKSNAIFFNISKC